MARTNHAANAESPSFAVLLRRYRIAAGLSQEELAERAGLSRRGISDLERGQRRRPHLATNRRIAASPKRWILTSASGWRCSARLRAYHERQMAP